MLEEFETHYHRDVESEAESRRHVHWQPILHKIIYYGCKAVSTSVASLFDLKRH